MAEETVTVNSGTGLDVAVDDTAAGAVQLVKLAHGTDGASSPIPGDEDGLFVQELNSSDILTQITALATALSAGRLLVTELNSADIETAIGLITALISSGALNVREENSADILAALAGGISVTVPGTVTVDGAITEYTEDGVAAGNPQGPMNIAVANDTLANEVASGDNVALRATRKGELCVKQTDVLEVKEALDATSSYAASLVQTTGGSYGSSLVVKSSPGVLYGLSGYNSKSTAQFIQVFDGTSAPSNGAEPKMLLQADGESNFNFPLEKPIYFSTGIVVCNSSTGPTKTLGSSDCFFQGIYK